METQEVGATVVTNHADAQTSNLDLHESPDNHLKHNVNEPKPDFHKDTFDIEPPDVKETQNQEPVEIDYNRTFPTEVSLEMQNHLEKAVREVIHDPNSREKEREGILEAEQKIRYKIIEQAQPNEPFVKGSKAPVVKPKRVIVRRKKEIRPARRIPKYLPKVDGGMWKVWGYPEMIELSTSSSEEVVEIPEGVELDQDGYPLLDPDRFDFTSLSPKWLRFLGKVSLYLLQSVTGFFMVKYAMKLWRSYTKAAELKHYKKPPNLSESSDITDSDDNRQYMKW